MTTQGVDGVSSHRIRLLVMCGLLLFGLLLSVSRLVRTKATSPVVGKANPNGTAITTTSIDRARRDAPVAEADGGLVRHFFPKTCAELNYYLEHAKVGDQIHLYGRTYNCSK